MTLDCYQLLALFRELSPGEVLAPSQLAAVIASENVTTSLPRHWMAR